jgi:hypothetical protein
VTPLCLSSDELRAAAHLSGHEPLPAFEEWASSERRIADAVAVRGLLARGLAEVCAGSPVPGLRLTATAAHTLDPLLAAHTVIEVIVDASGRRRRLAADAPSGSIVVTEREPALWQVQRTSAAAAATVADLASAILDGYADAELGQVEFTVDGVLLAGADGVLAQDPGYLPAYLRGRGVTSGTATRLAELLGAVRQLVTIRAVHRLGTTTRAAGAVTWLDAGAAGVWILDLIDDSAEDTAPATYRLGATDRAGLRAAIAEVLADRVVAA